MMKNKIARNQILEGLNMCRDILQIDGSAVIPLVVTNTLNEIGSCKICKHLEPSKVCMNPQAMYDKYMGDNLEWYCAEYEPRIEEN